MVTRRGGGDSEFTEMGKSIRSKRLKRLRTLKRELVTPHYDEKEALKNTVMEAALAAPKVVISKKRSHDEAMGELVCCLCIASLEAGVVSVVVKMCEFLYRLLCPARRMQGFNGLGFYRSLS